MDYKLIVPVLISFALSLLMGPVVIPFLRKLKMGQTERVEGIHSIYAPDAALHRDRRADLSD